MRPSRTALAHLGIRKDRFDDQRKYGGESIFLALFPIRDDYVLVSREGRDVSFLKWSLHHTSPFGKIF